MFIWLPELGLRREVDALLLAMYGVKRMFAIVLVVLVVAMMIATGAAIVFHRRISAEIDAVLADAQKPHAAKLGQRDIERLPAVVQQWLRYSRVIGTEAPETVRLRQQGQFNLGRGWMPFAADQYFTIDPPAFVWKASFRMAPMLSVAGRDQYRAGVASIDMRILSLVPVARQSGGGLNQGALLRLLGEMQWFPAAALSRFIVWESIDARSARATMAYGGVEASMTFAFGADGRLLEERASRYNDARRRNEMWVNRNDSDREFGGIRVPAVGEARWEYDTGPFPYIQWTITDLEQDRAARYSP